MQGPPGGGGWNPGGPPGSSPPGWGQPPGSSPGTPQQQPSAPGHQQPSAPGAPARTVALSQAELMSVHGQPGSAPGVPQQPQAAYPGAMPAQPVAMAQPAPTSVGVWIGIGMALLGVFSCLATGAAAALLGESQSVMVSYLTVPMIFAGFVAPIAGAVARKQSAPVAIGAPLGCGCATMLFALVAVVVFYQAIWPSL